MPKPSSLAKRSSVGHKDDAERERRAARNLTNAKQSDVQLELPGMTHFPTA